MPAYNAVFTTRRANLDDIRRLGCADVHYLPFAYDDVLFAPPDSPMDAPAYDVLFVGGADRDRLAFIMAFMKAGPPVALVGGYWDRFSATRPHALGHKPPETVRDWTRLRSISALSAARTATAM